MDELRSALFACLDVEDAGQNGVNHWGPILDRVRAAIDALADAPPPRTALIALTEEYRATAHRRGKEKFAFSPLYPYGVVNYIDAFVENLRYRELAAGHDAPCNCALVRAHGLLDHLQTKHFVKIGESLDFYDSYEDFRCSHCDAKWRREDCSTEQVSSWAWRPL